MSITAIVWVIIYIGGALLAFFDPVFGLYAYFWEYYGHPPYRWWGEDLPDLRWSFIIAVITFVAYWLRRGQLPTLEIQSHPQSKWLILFILVAAMVTPLAVWEERSLKFLIILIKYGALYFLIMKTVRTKEHFRYLLLVNIVGVAWWGWNAFDDPSRVDGRLTGVGGTDSYSDNATAAHLIAIMPFIGIIFLKGVWWERLICFLAAPFVLNVFILCNSRGGFLALMISGLAALVITRGELRRKAIIGVALGGLLFFYLTDPEFIERQMTMFSQEGEEDTARSHRLISWMGAFSLIADHPLGTGGGGFMALSPVYIPEVVESHDGDLRNVHNTYLQAASEWGILGFAFFAAYLVTTLIELHRIRKEAPISDVDDRIQAESIAIELSLIGMFIAGMFITRLYAEAFYWLGAFTAVLRNIQAREAKMAEREYARAAEPDQIQSGQLSGVKVPR